jgi:hypothetical protein
MIVGRLCQTPILSWRFTERSRRDASDTDGRLVRARKRERTSQTPYKSLAPFERLFGVFGESVPLFQQARRELES